VDFDGESAIEPTNGLKAVNGVVRGSDGSLYVFSSTAIQRLRPGGTAWEAFGPQVAAELIPVDGARWGVPCILVRQ
jgi:hypothetical protein